MPRKLLAWTVRDNPFIPQSPTAPQMRFLELECLEALYGGAAGGGKSSALLMAALQFVEVPGYSACIMRRNFTDLKLPGALIDRSHEWLSGKAKYNSQEHRWRFPSGATLQFGYCEAEKDVYRYQGSEFQFIGLDEGTQFSEFQMTYLFSRLRRRTSIPVPIRFRVASNPGGVGHEVIKRRFITEPEERVFIPAKLADNPYIDREQYMKALEQLDPVTRAQLLSGDWDALPSGRFNRETLNRYRYRIVSKEFNQGGEYLYGGKRVLCSECWVFITVDPAATAEGVRKRGDPDYTVISVWAVTPDKHLIWVDCFRFRMEIPDIVPEIQSVYAQYRPHFVGIEAVASNNAVAKLAKRTGMVVKELNPRGLDKLVRATPAMVMSESGRVWLPEKAHWLDDVVTELLLFTGDGKTHDDCCLAPGSLVVTDRGDIPIERVQVGSMVATRKGWRKVCAAEMTSPHAERIKVLFSDGRELVGTPSHPVWVEGKGFVRIDSLAYGDTIRTWTHQISRTLKPSSSTAESTGDTLTRHVAITGSTSRLTPNGSNRLSFSTERYGRPLTGQSRRGTTFTTLTGTNSTTTSAISSVLPRPNTGGLTRRLADIQRHLSVPTLSVSGRSLLNGIAPRKGEHGTESMVGRFGPIASQPFSFAFGAAANGKTSQVERMTSFALRSAAPLNAVRQESITRNESAPYVASHSVSTDTARRAIARVSVVGLARVESGPVYNLRVDGEPEFFANGVLVHNCDTLSYACALMDEFDSGSEGSRPITLSGRRW